MGRELRRVPLDFAWPLGKLWDGFVNPHRRPCPEAGRSCFEGYTGGERWLEALLRLLTLAAEEGAGVDSVADAEAWSVEFAHRGRTFPHPYLREFVLAPTFLPAGADRLDPGAYRAVPPTSDLARLMAALVGPCHAMTGFDMFKLRERLLRAAKLPKEWGRCPVCGGEDVDPAVRAAYDAWSPTAPPTGEGYQLWNTTTEGHPMSPVFATLDALCAWCEPNAMTFANHRATAAEWKQMLEAGCVAVREGNYVFS